jgi:hypothetical protein
LVWLEERKKTTTIGSDNRMKEAMRIAHEHGHDLHSSLTPPSNFDEPDIFVTAAQDGAGDSYTNMMNSYESPENGLESTLAKNQVFLDDFTIKPKEIKNSPNTLAVPGNQLIANDNINSSISNDSH